MTWFTVFWPYTLLKSDVTRRDHVVRCHESHECWFTHRQFHSQIHSRWHSLRITLKSTTLVHMRSGYAWTMKSWQRSEWRGFNSVLVLIIFFLSVRYYIRYLQNSFICQKKNALKHSVYLWTLYNGNSGTQQSCWKWQNTLNVTKSLNKLSCWQSTDTERHAWDNENSKALIVLLQTFDL